MAYAPKSPTVITTLGELRDYVEEEFRSIAQEFGEPRDVAFLKVTFAPPLKPREGMIVYADGTTWNPGAGRGTYEYRSGVWQKL